MDCVDSKKRTKGFNVARSGRIFKLKGQVVSMAPTALFATVSAIALSVGLGLPAAAGEISTSLTSHQTFTSNEDIAITATGSVSLSDASTFGVKVVPDYSSTFTNDGTISLTGDFSSGTALLFQESILSGGTVSNTGTIDVIGTSDTLELYGIKVIDDLAGDLLNSGTITVKALGTDDTASAVGILVGGDVTESGLLSNSGTITVVANVTDNYTAYAFGMDVSGAVLGKIINSGTLDVTAISSGTDYGFGYGIRVRGDLEASGSISNSGTVKVVAVTTDESTASGFGIKVGHIVGSISNTGSIEVLVSATGTYYAQAYGIDGGNLSGTISNSGTITVTADAVTDTAYAYGIKVGDVSATGSIRNSGTIKAIANIDTSDEAEAIAILSKELSGILQNSGTLTATATSTNTGDNAYATGIAVYKDNDITATGIMENTGSITVTATAAIDAAIARGLRANQDILAGGGIINSGSIVATANMTGNGANEKADIDGIYVGRNLLGSINNSGSITATATANQNAGKAYVTGIEIQGYLSGDIDNSGTMSLKTTAFADLARVRGINVVGDVNAGASITNSGAVTAAASNEKSDAFARGIRVGGNLSGDVKNSGTLNMSASVKSSESALAVGMKLNGFVSGSAVNSGTINLKASGDTTDDAEVYGFWLDNGLVKVGGAVTNSGSITGTARATKGDAYAAGFWLQDDGTDVVDVKGSLTNSGTITISAFGADSNSATATGAYIEGEISGSFVNSGTMTLLAQGGAGSNSAYAKGLYVEDDISGTLLNSGTISVTAIENTNFATAIGVHVDGVLSGSVTNSGTLKAVATSGAGSVSASGYKADSMSGTFSNTGKITASATGSVAANTSSYGIKFDNFDGVISNVGEISASGNGTNVYSIWLDAGTGTQNSNGGTGTLNIDTSDKITGKIRVDKQDVNLDAKGERRVFSFEDASTSTGTFTTSVSGLNTAWFTKGAGGSAPIYASVSTSDLGLPEGIMADLGGMLGSITTQLQSNFGETEAMPSLPFLEVGQSLRHFISVDTQGLSYASRNEGGKTDASLRNVTIGAAGITNAGADFAFGLGDLYGTGNNKTITDFDLNGFYLGGSVGKVFGSNYLDAGLGFGRLDSKVIRKIEGSAAATSEFKSGFATMHLGVQREFYDDERVSITGFGQLRHTTQINGGYTETGSTANTTVGKTKNSVNEAKLGFEISAAIGAAGTLTGSATAISRAYGGDDTTNIKVFGQQLDMINVRKNSELVKLGLGYDHSLSTNSVISFSVEKEIGNTLNGPDVKADWVWNF